MMPAGGASSRLASVGILIGGISRDCGFLGSLRILELESFSACMKQGQQSPEANCVDVSTITLIEQSGNRGELALGQSAAVVRERQSTVELTSSEESKRTRLTTMLSAEGAMDIDEHEERGSKGWSQAVSCSGGPTCCVEEEHVVGSSKGQLLPLTSRCPSLMDRSESLVGRNEGVKKGTVGNVCSSIAEQNACMPEQKLGMAIEAALSLKQEIAKIMAPFERVVKHISGRGRDESEDALGSAELDALIDLRNRQAKIARGRRRRKRKRCEVATILRR
ncbi:hypothetical protein CBR_g34566, partial [Chara braunii]